MSSSNPQTVLFSTFHLALFVKTKTGSTSQGLPVNRSPGRERPSFVYPLRFHRFSAMATTSIVRCPLSIQSSSVSHPIRSSSPLVKTLLPLRIYSTSSRSLHPACSISNTHTNITGRASWNGRGSFRSLHGSRSIGTCSLIFWEISGNTKSPSMLPRNLPLGVSLSCLLQWQKVWKLIFNKVEFFADQPNGLEQVYPYCAVNSNPRSDSYSLNWPFQL